MAKDDKRYQQIYDILIPSVGISMDPFGFDGLIGTNGLVFEHEKAILCPIGVKDRFDIRADHLDCKCDNGHLYVKAGCVTAFFSGNATSSAFENQGVVDGSTVQITLARTYDESDEEVVVQEYDRFFLRDYTGYTSHQQRFEAHQSGTDRLEFPAIGVEYLMDAQGETYKQGQDFGIDGQGFIVWTGSRRPGYDPKLQKGTVCSIRYRFRPHWFCARIMHEIRVIKAVDQITGEVSTARMPFAIMLQRELVFRSKPKTSATDNDPRGGSGPQNGSFGPR